MSITWMAERSPTESNNPPLDRVIEDCYSTHINSKEQIMKVYVVLEKDRGYGVSVAGVFASLESAKAYLAGPEGSNCYLDSEFGEELQGQ